MQFHAKLDAATKLIIAGDPRKRHLRPAALEQTQAVLPTLLEPDLLRHVRLLASRRIVGPLGGQVQTPIHEGLALAADITEEDADLTILDLAEPAAPLPLYATRVVPRLRERTGIEHEHGVGIRQFLSNVLAKFGHHALVVPRAGADKMLHRLALQSSLIGDRLGRLTIQAAEFAMQDDASQLVLFHTIEPRQIAAQETLQMPPATGHLNGGNFGICQQNLGSGSIEQGHPCPSGKN